MQQTKLIYTCSEWQY